MDHEAVEHLDEEDGNMALLDSLLVLTSIVNVEEDESPGEGRDRKTSLLGLTLVLLCSTLCLITNRIGRDSANYKDITIAAQSTYHIFNKLLLDEHVYHDILNSTLKNVSQIRRSYSSPAEMSSKLSAELSVHGVLNNLAVKLISDIHGLLILLNGADTNSVNAKLSPLLESLNCTLGSLNRALDPLPGGKYAMDGELYNAHLTPHMLSIVPTRVSEPTVSYCCTSYKQLTI